jgi:hypothetical protein
MIHLRGKILHISPALGEFPSELSMYPKIGTVQKEKRVKYLRKRRLIWLQIMKQ